MKSQQERANELVAAGNQSRTQGRLKEAIAAYREAIRLVPAYGSLNLVLADMLFERQEYAEAGEAYRKTVEYVPDHDQAWAGLGQCLLLQDDHAGALEAFTNALNVNPQNADANYYGAMLYVLQGDRKKAADHLAAALQTRPAWESNAREDNLLQGLFDESRKLAALDGGKKWWQFWKRREPKTEPQDTDS